MKKHTRDRLFVCVCGCVFFLLFEQNIIAVIVAFVAFVLNRGSRGGGRCGRGYARGRCLDCT